MEPRLAADLGAAAACELYRAFLVDLSGKLTSLPADVAVEWWVDGAPEALAPLANLFGYSSTMRGLSQGRAT